MHYSAEQVADLAQQRFAFVDVSLHNHVLRITLNRPAKKNAMNPGMMAEIAYAMAYAHFTPEVWAVVLAANGDVFCAGADLKAFAGQDADADKSTIPAPTGEVLLGELFVKVHKPCIARVHGPVYAGGFLLIGGCHYVVAADTATFALPEVKRGLYPMQVMASLLPVMPARKVLDLCLRGHTFSAQEAQQAGLVTHLAPAELLDVTLDNLLAELLQNSPTALRYGLQAFDELRSIGGAEAHAYLKGMLGKLLQTEDAREGIAAFAEKRKPNWTGK